jgi:hypothetical protein
MRSTAVRPALATVRVVLLAALLLPGRAFAAQDQLLVFQPDMPPEAGAATLLTVQHVLASVEDWLLPASPFREERGVPRRSAGVAYRWAKLVFIDAPQDHFFVVLAHEVYGHGSRFREFGLEERRYSFEAPPPYGEGGGRAAAVTTRPLTRAELAAIYSGGLEAHDLLNARLARQGVVRGALHYREALLYMNARLEALSYVRSTPDEDVPSGHDVANFLDTINRGCEPPACRPITPADARRRARIGLVDPLLAWSLASTLAYVALGRETLPLWMFPLPGGVRYLPAPGLMLAPYGTEWTVGNHFLREGRALHLTVRAADAGPAGAWGVGADLPEIARRGRLTVGGAAHVWRQPRALSRTADAGEAGGALIVTLHAPLRHATVAGRALHVHADAGYKTAGFLPGEPLAGGPIVRLGMRLSGRAF